jgi:PAS domain S-box-containing protein
MIHEPDHASIRRAAWPVLLLAGGLVLVIALPAPAWIRGMAAYTSLHLVLELVSIIASAMVFVVSWSALRKQAQSDAIWLGATFLGVTLLDLGHALSYTGMPDLVTPAGPEKAIDFWLAARTLAALGLLGIVLPWTRRLVTVAAGRSLIAGVLLLTGGIFAVVLWRPEVLPRTYLPGVGLTSLKIGWEYALVLCHLVVAVWLMLRGRDARRYDVSSLFVANCALSISGFLFTRYAEVTDHYNLFGHVCKVVGYGYLFRAIFVESVVRPYRDLATAQSRLRATIEGIPDLLWLKDTDGVYLDCNPTFERLYGASRGDIVGRTDRDFVGAELAAFFRHHDERALAAGGPRVNEEWLTFASDGYKGLFETVKTPVLDADGRPIGVLGVARDITERRNAEIERQALEGQLREAQKMESLGTLAGGIAHDFNNVLGAILGHVALAREQLSSDHPARESLEQIGRSSGRARDLVQQILAFSRRHPQRMANEPLRPLVEETVAMLKATLPARVQLRTWLEDAPMSIRADATQIQQVLMNLCTNAWHALRDSTGEIGIGLEPLRVDEAAARRLGLPATGAWAHLWVRDDGVGMDESTRARVFEPFFTTKAPGRGTGLGLAVAHGIVSAHGGEIRVDSAPGAGTTFHLYLPLQETDAVEDGAATHERGRLAAANPQRIDGRGRHVLYVDDDDVMLVMVEALLRRDGWRVSTCTRAADAVALFVAAPDAIDALVTDFNMPDGSGLELVAALRALRPDLPVIVSSGYLSEDLLAGAVAAGIGRVLQKQNTVDELPQMLGEMLSP